MKLITFTFLTVLLFSCSSGKKLKTIPLVTKPIEAINDSLTRNIAQKKELAFANATPLTMPRGSAFTDQLLADIKSKKFDRVNLQIAGKKATSFDTISKWRVQITALSDKQKAIEEIEKFSSIDRSPSFIIEAKGLYKIQVGNFAIRAKADQLLHDLKSQGYNGGWVVKAFELRAKHETKPLKDSSSVPIEINSEPMFRVQVGTFSSKENASRLVAQIKQEINDKVQVFQESASYKVLVGGSAERAEIDLLKAKLLDLGHNGFVVKR